MSELKQYEKNFIEKLDEVKETNILGNLTNELTDEFLDTILSTLLDNYGDEILFNDDLISTGNLLNLAKINNYDIDNISLLMAAIKKCILILKKYNIDAYYAYYYANDKVDHKIEYENGMYYIVDNFNMRRIVDFDVYGLSRTSFKCDKRNITTMYYNLKSREKILNRPKIKYRNNQLF